MGTKNTLLGGALSQRIVREASRIVLVGIGGIGMSCLAQLFLHQNKSVTGQDTTSSQYTKALEQLGVNILYHNDAFPLFSGDVLVYTAAVSPTHPTLVKAQAMGLPILSRADALAGIMEHEVTKIAVAGMHGKSTTTAILGHILKTAQMHPTVVCGGEMTEEQSPLLKGNGTFLFEACEYMSSFLSFSPDLSVLLNLEWEHTDCFPREADAVAAFRQFANQSKRLVLGYDSPLLRTIGKGKERVFYSLCDRGADIWGGDIRQTPLGHRFSVYQNSQPLFEAELSLLGKMNVSNALAAIAAALMLGVKYEDIQHSLLKETGIKRRLEHKGFLGKTPIFDDYAHHPTEILASIEALRPQIKGELYLLFQSHTYSRTKAFFSDIVSALCYADHVLVTDVYPARETDTKGVSGEALALAIGKKARYISTLSQGAEYLTSHAKEEDGIIVMGAGDVGNIFSLLRISKRKNL